MLSMRITNNKRYWSYNKANEYTTAEIAEALGLTTVQVLSAEKSALRKLSVWLHDIDAP